MRLKTDTVFTDRGRLRSGILLLFAAVMFLLLTLLPGKTFAEGECSLNIDFGTGFPTGEPYDSHPVKVGLYKVGSYNNGKFSMDDGFKETEKGKRADFIDGGVSVDEAVEAANLIIEGFGDDYQPDYEETVGTDGIARFTGMNAGVYFGKVTDAPSEFKASYFFVTLETSVNMDISAKWSLVTSAKVIKKWEDDQDRDGLRPTEIYVQLYQNGTAYTPQDVTMPIVLTGVGDEWSYEVNDLPKFLRKQSKEREYKYSWKEVNSDGEEISEFPVEIKEKDEKENDVVIRSGIYTVSNPKTDEQNNPETDEQNVDSDASNVWISTIVNTHVPEHKTLSVKKKWNDADNNDNKRPADLTVTLLADGFPADKSVFVNPDEAKSEYVLNDGNNWEEKTPELLVYRHGNTGGETNGQKIDYTWSEPTISEYSVEKSGYDEKDPTLWVFENSHTPGEVSSTVHKSWNDGNNQDGLRADSVTVHLLQNGTLYEEQEPVVLNAANGWMATIKNLPEYTNKTKNVYTWSEDPVPGYDTAVTTASGSTFTIVNPHTPDEVQESIEKIWDDDGNRDGIRPRSIQVQLTGSTSDNPTVLTRIVTLSAANNWKETVTGLPRCNNGKAIIYVWKEVGTIKGYESQGAVRDSETRSTTITNKYEPKTTSIKVSKVWNDENNLDNLRTQYITVALLANGKTIDQQRLNADNNWSYNWDKLNVSEAGKDITYRVQEVDIPKGYTVSYSGGVADGFVVTNTHIPNSTRISVEKVWDDNDDADDLRPETITVKLYANGTDTGLDAVLNADNEWSHVWANLQANTSDGEEIAYTVDETAVPDGYEKSITGSMAKGFVITNKHGSAQGALRVTKQVTVNGAATTTTQADGTYTFTVTGPNDYSYSFRITITSGQARSATLSGLEPGTYTVTETVPNGMTLTSQNNQQLTVEAGNEANIPTATFVNNINPDVNGGGGGGNANNNNNNNGNGNVPQQVQPDIDGGRMSVNGQKIWNDENNAHGTRPDGITIRLYANGTDTGNTPTWTNTNGNTWTYSFENLPDKDNNGNTIRYSVSEDAVAGYQSTANGTVFVNRLIPRTPERYININGVKTWADNGNEAGLRPNYITVQLVRDGVTVDTRTVSAGTAWNYSFDNLPADDGYGHTYNYFVREAGVPGYYSTTDGYNLINSLIPRTQTVVRRPYEERTVEELEDMLDLFDYDTPLFGGLLGTGDTMPVYPFIFGAIGVAAIVMLFLFGKDPAKKKGDKR